MKAVLWVLDATALLICLRSRNKLTHLDLMRSFHQTMGGWSPACLWMMKTSPLLLHTATNMSTAVLQSIDLLESHHVRMKHHPNLSHTKQHLCQMLENRD